MTDSTYPCVQCGSPVPRNAQFCLVCGTPASTRSQSAALGTVAGSAPAAGHGSGSGTATGASWKPAPAVTPIRRSELIRANYGRRVFAFLLDSVFNGALWLLIVLPLTAVGAIRLQVTAGVVSTSGLSAVLLLVAGLLYPLANLFLQSFLGFSPGKAIMGLRIVRFETLTRPGLGRMLLRGLIVWAASLVFGIGQLVVWLSPLWDATGLSRGWHDKVAGTWVIDVKAGPNPLTAAPGQVVVDAPPTREAATGRAGGGAGGDGSGAGGDGQYAGPPVPGAYLTAGQGSGPFSGVVAPAPAGAPAPGGPPAPIGAPVGAPAGDAPGQAAPPAPPAAAPAPAFGPPPGGAPAPLPPLAEPISMIPGFSAPVITPAELAGAEAGSPVGTGAVGAGAAEVTDADAESTRLSTPGPAVLPPGTTAFRLDSGQVVPITGHGVLGRAPVSPANDPADLLFTLPGDTLSISKTHLEFGLDAGRVWVSDRGSTNGSVLLRGDGVELPLLPGQRFTVARGDRIRVGARLLTVEGGA